MKEFKDVLFTKRYDSGYWKNRFAKFYLKHKDYTKSIEYYTLGIYKYPSSKEIAEMYFGLGKTYLAKKENNLAIKHFKKAVEIAKKRLDSKLSVYEAELSQVK